MTGAARLVPLRRSGSGAGADRGQGHAVAYPFAKEVDIITQVTAADV